MTTRRNILKGGAGLAAILASGKAPAYIVRSMLAARNSIGMKSGGAKLPYDAEVEYLESTGTQWIDLQIFGSSASRVDIIGLVKTEATGTRRFILTTAIGPSPIGSSTYFDVNADGYFGQNSNGFICTPYTRYDISVRRDGYYSDGVNVYIPYYVYPLRAEKSLCLFAFVSIGRNRWVGRVSGVKIWDNNGVLVRDLIPVRFTNELGQSEGAMYDRVSGKLFRNQGTGAFLYGRDINPISARSYVKDGLIAMWDGIENAGWGIHDANATV